MNFHIELKIVFLDFHHYRFCHGVFGMIWVNEGGGGFRGVGLGLAGVLMGCSCNFLCR
jgi:hypothetical protein